MYKENIQKESIKLVLHTVLVKEQFRTDRAIQNKIQIG